MIVFIYETGDFIKQLTVCKLRGVNLSLVTHSFSYYILYMTITKTVNIPTSRRITVPNEVPTGPVIITFTPIEAAKKPRITEAEERELFRLHADELNSEALDVLSYQVP